MKKNNKYNAQKTTVDGIVFDSKREAARYMELMLLQRAGEISHLELQPKYDCIIDGKKICSYKADFRYFTKNGNIVEDVKGYITPMFKLKKKLVEAIYSGVTIEVIKWEN